jgi:hypothetical protein
MLMGIGDRERQNCPLVLMFDEMPLPPGPVTGNSFFPEIFSLAYQ